MLDLYVLDTTIASLLFRKRPELALYQAHLENSLLTICFQTVAEMRFGVLKVGWGLPRRQELERYFAKLHLVVYEDRLASTWAQIVYEAEQTGRRLEAGDAWIAATAKYLNAPLLTHDKDFSPQACPSITVYCYAT